MDFGHEVPNKENPTTGNLLSILTTAINKQSDLFNVFGNRDPWKEPWNVFATGLKLLLVPDLALDPAIGIERRFHVNKGALLRMKGDDVQFAVIASLGAFSNLNISSDKVAPELIPLRDKRFEMIACHNASLLMVSVLLCGGPKR